MSKRFTVAGYMKGNNDTLGSNHISVAMSQIELIIVCEYDQDIPHSQTVDRKSHTTITRHQEDKLSKATSSLFPIKMIAKLEET